jgi:3-mercaptopyruvate sulfurtransferase SseA
VALQLKKRGIKNVRPLAGGLAEWKRLDYPVQAPALISITPVAIKIDSVPS